MTDATIILDEHTPFPSWEILIREIYRARCLYMCKRGTYPKVLYVPITRKRDFLMTANREIRGYPTDRMGISQLSGLNILWAMDGGIRVV